MSKIFSIICILLLGACSKPAELVIYCSLDQDLSEQIIRDFEKKHDIEINVQFDVERNKTVGLVSRIIAEAKTHELTCSGTTKSLTLFA